MLSQSRLQRQRLQRCRIYPQVGDKSHWNSRERVLEPEELSFLGGPPTSDTETREGAKRAAEGASPLTYAWANTSLTLAPQCLHSPSNRIKRVVAVFTLACLSLAQNGSSLISCFKRRHTIEIRNGIIFNFLRGTAAYWYDMFRIAHNECSTLAGVMVSWI